jgi:ATP-dependent Clp protease ATP-binding subunit ClpA
MPKLSVYVPDELAAAVRETQVPVSAICQAALERAVREVTAARGADDVPPADDTAPAVGLFGRFTPRARQAVALSQGIAQGIPHNYIGTEHVLLGVLDQGDNVATRALLQMDVAPDDVRAELRASLGPPADERPTGHIPFTPLAKRALELTAREALTLGHSYIGCEHLLLGLLATDEGVASKVLRRMGVETRTSRMAVISILTRRPPLGPQEPAPPETPPGVEEALARILARIESIEKRLDS